MPDVLAAVSGEDTPKGRWDSFQKDQYPLAVVKVRYVGDEVDAVDEATAEEGLSLIEVEYEPLPAVFYAEAAMRPEAPLIHEDKPGNLALHFVVVRRRPGRRAAAGRPGAGEHVGDAHPVARRDGERSLPRTGGNPSPPTREPGAVRG